MAQNFSSMVDQLFTSLLGFKPELELIDTEDQVNIALKLEPQDSGLLIGHHGEVLTSLQLLLALMYHQQTGDRKPVRLNINDYREQREQALQSLADSVAQKVLERKSPVSIGNLTSFERRIVHLHLSERTDVITHSEGEPPHRVLTVSPL